MQMHIDNSHVTTERRSATRLWPSPAPAAADARANGLTCALATRRMR